jgi:predicted GTPase
MGSKLNTEQLISKITSELSEKKKLLEAMLHLTKKQSEAIASDDIERLQSLIEEKQKLIDKINKIDDSFNEDFTNLKISLGVNNLEGISISGYAGAEEMQGMVKTIIELTGNIGKAENRNQTTLKESMKSISDDLNNISKAKKARDAYVYKDTNLPSYFIDKKK